ncbi:MAG: MBG domain-containing protein, partial [Catenulispora sp.]
MGGNCGTPPPPGSPRTPDGPADSRKSRTVGSFDPNEKLASAGYGDAVYLPSDDALAYQVRFENKADATAPARQIVITDTLDTSLDLDSFELAEITFADQSIHVPAGLDHYEATLPVKANGNDILVDVQAALDRATRTLTLTLRAVDPATGTFPEDPLVGLLYPNDATGRGAGSVSYRVAPRAGLPSGTEVRNRARIVFDFNDPIDTPLVHNTLDAAAPTSSVLPLPATTTDPTLLVRWSGRDEDGGSGVAGYDVYVSADGGAYALLVGNTTDTSATVTGQAGHTYAFYSVAADNVGHRQATPATAQATITVQGLTATTTTALISDQPAGSTYGQAVTFTATVSVTGGGGPPTGTMQFAIDGGNVGGLATLSGGQAALTPALLTAGPHTVAAFYTSDSSAFGNSDDSATPLGQAVAPAPLTVTADSKTRVYGQDNPALTGTLSGVVNGDNITVTYATTATSTSDAGGYAITPVLTDPNSRLGNYTVTATAGTLTVTPAHTATLVTSSSAQDTSTYGDPVTFTAAVGNSDSGYAPAGSVEFFDGSTDLGPGTPGVGVSSTWTYTTAALHAGPHAIKAVYLPAGDPQDFLGSDNSGDLLTQTVNPAPLLVKAEDGSRAYGQPNPAFAVRYAGLVKGDGPPALAGALTFTTSADARSDVGGYSVTPAGLTSTDYSITFADGTLTITRADQAILWNSPAAIAYGTPLGVGQLNASVSVVGPAPAGALTYSVPGGTDLHAGAGQVLTVRAAGTHDYNPATAS